MSKRMTDAGTPLPKVWQPYVDKLEQRIKELKSALKVAVQMAKDECWPERFPKCFQMMAEALEQKAEREYAAQLEMRLDAVEAAYKDIRWESSDKDNMEFTATITVWQYDKIKALEQKEALGGDDE